ncbi:MAG TPA: hypothetical protein VKU39_02275 [Streptosporangiaceae bacterium]|nr:hypothetical protein [Streptosporangiaceae bacterium]
MELTNWRQLSDRGSDLVPCLDFPGSRAAAGFAELAAGVPVEVCFLHFKQNGGGALAACVDRWTDELLATGRPVRAVLGFCAGTAMATRLADAIAATGPPPIVVLFDALPTTGESLASQFVLAVESNAKHLTAGELADAQELSEQLMVRYPDDLPRIAAALAGRYELLIRAVAERLSVSEFLRKELTGAFTAYMDYLLLASEGGFEMRAADPVFLCSAGYEPPVAAVRSIALEVDHDDLLRDPRVHELVADLLRGGRLW